MQNPMTFVANQIAPLLRIRKRRNGLSNFNIHIVNFGGGEIIRGQRSPGPTAGAGLLVYRLRTAAFSAGGDGGRKLPEHSGGAIRTRMDSSCQCRRSCRSLPIEAMYSRASRIVRRVPPSLVGRGPASFWERYAGRKIDADS